MKTDSYCTSCGALIPHGEGHYDTPHGLYCLRCGCRLPIPRGTKVIVEIQDPDGRLARSGKERS